MDPYSHDNDGTTGSTTTTNNIKTIKPFRIGMMGAGTVGGGAYEIIMGKGDVRQQPQQHQRPIIITKILVRSLDKERDFHIDTNQTMITTNVDTFFSTNVANTDTTNNKKEECDIDCFVEVAGGCTVAKDMMLRAIQDYHIPVITANKAALFEYNHDFQTALLSTPPPLQQPQRMGIEAAVCGGIPIINILQTCYVGDRITSICGICNGTTNYMLSKMDANPTEVLYDDALKEAQQLGYAEADPTADVEGHDVRAKIALLAQLAFGIQNIPVQSIPCTGITKVTADDFIIIQKSLPTKYTIKLIGRAYTASSATTTTTTSSSHDTAAVQQDVGVYVTPMLIPCTGSTLANVDGCGNAVQITSTNLSTCTYLGPGAGRLPTANSIVADIYRAVNNTLPSLFSQPISYENTSFNIVTDYTASFYIRIKDQSSTTTTTATTANRLSDIIKIFEQMDVTFQQITMPTITIDSNLVVDNDTITTTADHFSGSTLTDSTAFYVIMTDIYPISIIQHVCNEIQRQIKSTESILYLPVLAL